MENKTTARKIGRQGSPAATEENENGNTGSDSTTNREERPAGRTEQKSDNNRAGRDKTLIAAEKSRNGNRTGATR